MPSDQEGRSGSTGKDGGFLIRSFSLADTKANRELLKEAHVMAKKDGDSFSNLVVSALSEYIKRHSPGNPQLILRHWTEAMPLPESTRNPHVHSWRQILVRETCGVDAWACTDLDCRELWYQPFD